MLKAAAVLSLLALPAQAEDPQSSDEPMSAIDLIEICRIESTEGRGIGVFGSGGYCAGYIHAWLDARQCPHRIDARIDLEVLLGERDDMYDLFTNVSANTMMLTIVAGRELCR